MKQSDKVNELAQALAGFQADMPPIPRSASVDVRMKNGGTYSFSYAPLGAIADAIRPVMAEHGLSYTQGLFDDPNGVGVETMVLHKSGQWISSGFVMPYKGGPQDAGSAITYARRYALTAALGIVADEDDDANSASGNEASYTRKPSPAATRAPSNGTPAAARSAPETKQALEQAAKGKTRAASDGQLKYARASLSKLVDGDADKAKMILYHVFQVESSADLTSGQASALIDWAGATADNDYTPVEAAQIEAGRLLTAFRKEQGQQDLFPDAQPEPAGAGAYTE